MMSIQRKRPVLGQGAFLLVAVAVAFAGCDQASGPANEGSPADQASGSQPPAEPQLEKADLATLQQLIEETASDDQALVVNFWSSSCDPCRTMFGTIHDGVSKLPDARVATVSFDPAKRRSRAGRFVAGHQALKDAYIVPGDQAQTELAQSLGREWQAADVPAVLVFNKQGELVSEYVDPSDPKQLAREVVAEAVRLASQTPGGSEFEPVTTQPDPQELEKIEKKAREDVREGRVQVDVEKDNSDGQDGGSTNEPGL
jgi:thiol-disulfide isomerase/thioredoxin